MAENGMGGRGAKFVPILEPYFSFPAPRQNYVPVLYHLTILRRRDLISGFYDQEKIATFRYLSHFSPNYLL
jgi:hypothetical protein